MNKILTNFRIMGFKSIKRNFVDSDCPDAMWFREDGIKDTADYGLLASSPSQLASSPSRLIKNNEIN